MANEQPPDPKYEEEVSGCTASVGIISKDKIYVVRPTLPLTSQCILNGIGKLGRFSNCTGHQGPRKAALVRPQTSERRYVPWFLAKNMTDHYIAEKARIQAAGGFVDFGRVNGNLALSRAIGDFEFKKSAELPPESQIVTAFPDVEIHNLSPDDEFLIVACDGKCV